MNTTSDPWQPYRSDGKGKQPIPEVASYGLFFAAFAVLVWLRVRWRRQ